MTEITAGSAVFASSSTRSSTGEGSPMKEESKTEISGMTTAVDLSNASSESSGGSRNTSPSSQMLSSTPATEKLLSMLGEAPPSPPPSSPTSIATTLSSSSSSSSPYSPPSYCRNITPDGRSATWEIGMPAGARSTGKHLRVEAPTNDDNDNKNNSISVRAQQLKSSMARWMRVKTGQSIELPQAKYQYDQRDHEIYTVIVPNNVRQGKKFLLQLPCGLKALVPCPEHVQPGQELKFCVSGEQLRYHRENRRKAQEDREKWREYELQRRKSKQILTISEKDIHINLAPIRASLRRLGSSRKGSRDEEEEIVFTDGGDFGGASLLLEKRLLDDYEGQGDESKQSALPSETFTIM